MLNSVRKSEFLMKVLKGFSWVAGGNIIGKVLMSIAYIAIAKILTVEENGEFGIMKSTIDNFLIFATMGIGLTSTKYLSELKRFNKKAAGEILGASLISVLCLGFLMCLLIWTYSDYIALHILKAEHLKNLLVYASFILLLTSLNSVQQGALIGLQSFKNLSISYISQGLLIILGLVIGANVFQVEGAMRGYLLAVIVLTLIIQFLLRQELTKQNITLSFTSLINNIKTISLFAIPASLSTIISAPSNWVLNTTLARQDNGYYELGLYSAIIVFSMGIRTLNASLGSVLLPLFLEDNNPTRKKEFVNYFSPWIIAIFLSLPFLVYPNFITLILGDKYPIEKVIPISTFAFIITIIIGHKQGISRDLIKKNKMWLSAFSMFQWATTTLIINSFLKQYGAFGLSLSLTLGYILNLLIFVPIFIQLKISPKFIFYNKYVIVILFLLLLFMLINTLLIESPFRLILSCLNCLIIIFLIFKFARSNIT